MKIALYIEDGLEQIVLTPESRVETDLLGKIHDDNWLLQLRRGRFYACRGGWIRHGVDTTGCPDSTIIVLRPAVEEPSP